MGRMEDFYRRLGVPAAKNPASSEGRELDRKVRKIMDYLDRHGKGYFETLSEINSLLDRAAAQAGLSMVDYVNTAVPYDRTVSLLLATSDPNVFVHVSVYRMPSGRYELVAYPTRESLRKRGLQGRRRNPEGDVEDTLSKYLAETIFRKLEDEWEGTPATEPEHRVPVHKGAFFAARADKYDPALGLALSVWTETADGVPDSPVYRLHRNAPGEDFHTRYIDSVDLEPLADALHYALHHGTLRGYSAPEAVQAQQNPSIRLERNPEGEEPEGEEPVEESWSALPADAPELKDAYEDAEKVYETFHGKESEEEVVVEEAVAMRENLAAIGALEELTLTSPAKVKFRIAFEDDQPLLCSSTDCNQLYIIGGDQSIDDETLAQILDGDTEAVQKDKVLLGVLNTLVYRTEKDFDNFETIDYEHELGEEGGFQPAVIYDRINSQLELVGGSYKIKREGIVN